MRTSIHPSEITILIGPNSSGKSSILQALLILRNAMKKSTSSYLITQDDAVQFGNYEDIVTDGNTNKSIQLEIQGNKLLPSGLDNSYPEIAKFGYAIEAKKEGLVSVYLGMKIDDIAITFDWKVDRDIRSSVRGRENNEKMILRQPVIDGFHPRMSLSVQPDDPNSEFNRRFNELFANSDFTKKLLDDYFYVPPNRTATKYGVILSPKRDELPYSSPEQMISYMISNLSKDPNLLNSVSTFIEELSGKRIRTRNMDLQSNQGVTIDFVRKNFSNSIINEGTGLNQVVLLLAILAGSHENSIIGIEEPEIHLHPKAQNKLAQILLNLAEKRQLIFTTHSEHMLYPFLASIAGKKIRKEQLAIYYVDSDTNNHSTIERMEINDLGQIRGGMKGFWDTDLETFAELMGENNG